MQEKVKASGLALSSNAALVIDGQHLRIEGLRLEGALVVELAPACSLTLREAVVQNKGWRWMALNPDKPMTEEWFIRCLHDPPSCFAPCRGFRGEKSHFIVWGVIISFFPFLSSPPGVRALPCRL